jgi:hypothetical protein
MSERKDIIDGKLAKGRKYGLIYTKKCGWIDLGHANLRVGHLLCGRI